MTRIQSKPGGGSSAVAQPPGGSDDQRSARVPIGEAAKRSAVSAKMIRHYESLGLLPEVPRTDAGYRQYDEASVHTLRFIRRARDLGFGMAEIGTLLGLWQNQRRQSSDVKRVAQTHIADLQRRIDEMQAMKRALEHLAGACHGSGRPDCPILDDLSGGRVSVA